MRFIDYIKLSSNKEDEVIFRSLKVGIIKDNTNYIDIIERLSTKHRYVKESIDIIDNINRKLKKYYKGKYKYGFCIDEDKPIYNIRINKNHKNILYMEYLRVNDEFNEIKKRFEKELSDINSFTPS
jgi:hypothetical protein